MSTRAVPPPAQWETFEFRGRSFYWFPVKVREGEVPFTIAHRVADRYRVGSVLARGGDGIILEATDLRTENPVLIKAVVWHKAVRADLEEPLEEFVEQVRRSRHHVQTERRVLVQLHRRGSSAVPHPNDYVFDTNPMLEGPHYTEQDQEWTFDDWSLIDAEPYLVMQRAAGTSLQERLEREGGSAFDEPAALRIIDQTAAVLEQLHEPFRMANGQTWELVYQDMKPGNLLVDDQGRVTVLDFGGCQVVIDGTLVLRGSHSPGYCAPECGPANPDPIAPTADCYALGSTLYHLLTGVNPRRLLPKDFRDSDTRAVRLDTAGLAGRCSKATADLIARCVAWEPAARFQTVRELRAALAPLV
jgi:serine/threonine protein kinase